MKKYTLIVRVFHKVMTANRLICNNAIEITRKNRDLKEYPKLFKVNLST